MGAAAKPNRRAWVAAVLAVVLAFLIGPAAGAAAPVIVWAVGDGPNPYPGTRTKEVVDFLARQRADHDLDALLWLGDIYNAPTDQKFNQLYGSTYGRFAKETYPTPGNHELGSNVPLKPYDDYWRRKRPEVLGSRARLNPGGYDNLYAANLGNGWRLLGLTTSFIPPDSSNDSGAPEAIPPQAQDVVDFVEHDLATHTGTCYIAIMHRPRYSASGRSTGQNTDLQAIWEAMAGRVDLYIQGHEHEYFRLDPALIPEFYPAPAPPDVSDVNKELVPGAQSFVVGTGGITLDYLNQPGQIFQPGFPGLEKYLVAPDAADKLNLDYYGALRLSLRRGRVSWQYEKLDGSVYDSGATSCTPVRARRRAR